MSRHQYQAAWGSGGEHSDGPADAAVPDGDLDEHVTLEVDAQIARAVHRTCGSHAGPRLPLLQLAAGPAGLGPRIVRERMCWRIDLAVAGARSRGWGVQDLLQVVRRRQGSRGHALLTTHLTRSASTPPVAWTVADAQWPTSLAAALELCELVEHLPALPPVEVAGEPAAGTDSEQDRTLGRVRALLAKAESSEFSAEAELLMQKAHELMTRYSLDRAMVEGTAGAGRDRDRGRGGRTVTARRCWLDDPYLSAKASLLSVVATASRCRAVLSGRLGFATLVGHPDDLDLVEMLFTSLLVQADFHLAAAGSDVEGSGARGRRPAFRRSFFYAFAQRIGERLELSARATTRQAADDHGAGLLPVLARRSQEVDELVGEMFGRLGRSSVRVSDGAGWVAGRTAGDLADLAAGPQVRPGTATPRILEPPR